MASPNIPQGVLNRLRGSITFSGLNGMNITAPFLGKEGINLTFGGEAANVLETMTGTVQSQVPFIMCTCEVELLKTQSFSDQWKQLMETNSNVGNMTVRPDSSTLSNYPIMNSTIITAAPGRLNGESVGFVLGLRGYYQVNSALYNNA